MGPGKVQAVEDEGMDFDTVSAEVFGRSLRGLGLNLLVRDVPEEVAFLRSVFGLESHRVSKDFAIVRYAGTVFQVHADATYHANPLLGLLPELPPRGAGVEIRLYETDPDMACERARNGGFEILQRPTDKPHGLREAYILCPNGYAWVVSRPLQAEPTDRAGRFRANGDADDTSGTDTGTGLLPRQRTRHNAAPAGARVQLYGP